jgi:hypothetical protein
LGLAVTCCDYHPLRGHHSSPRLGLLANGVGAFCPSGVGRRVRGLDGIVVRDAISVFDGLFIDDLIYKRYSKICMKGMIGYEPWGFVIERNIFDWNVCRTFVLEGLLQPHSSIPYVQIGNINAAIFPELLKFAAYIFSKIVSYSLSQRL